MTPVSNLPAVKESRILLTVIFKDDSEAEMAERMLSSFMPWCHGLVAVFTGPSGKFEKLSEIVTRFKGKYLAINPESHPNVYLQDGDKYIFANFAAARNISFELAEKEQGYDWWMWADVDDVILNGNELQMAAQKGKELDLDQIFFAYWYSVNLDEKGNVRSINIDHLRERLLKPGLWKWVSRLHEVVVPKDDNYHPKYSAYDYKPEEGRNVAWIHLVNEERMNFNSERNIKILEVQAREEQHKDPRTVFYLAKSYYDKHDPQKYTLIEELIKEYLDMSGWAEERSYAWEYLGNVKGFRGDHQGAIDAYLSGLKEFPNRHMIMLLLSKEYFETGNIDYARFWVDVVLRMDPPQTRTTIGNPLEIKVLAASIKYNLAFHDQNLKEAINWLTLRNELANIKDDDRLNGLKELSLLNEAAHHVFDYAKWLKDNGHADKVRKLLESLPIELGREAFAHFIANEVSEPRQWADNEIAYYASFGGEHFEQWSGNSLSSGIGGSETAVIELAKEWTKLGYKVTVYGDPRQDEGEIDGVIYKPWYQLNWKDKFNILILWRSPHLVGKVQSTKKLFMDLHDVCSQLDYPPESIKKIDKVFVKSKYHRSMLPNFPDEKVAVISNGIRV